MWSKFIDYWKSTGEYYENICSGAFLLISILILGIVAFFGSDDTAMACYFIMAFLFTLLLILIYKIVNKVIESLGIDYPIYELYLYMKSEPEKFRGDKFIDGSVKIEYWTHIGGHTVQVRNDNYIVEINNFEDKLLSGLFFQKEQEEKKTKEQNRYDLNKSIRSELGEALKNKGEKNV